MVEETNFEGKILFKCMKCRYLYKDKKIAEKCEKWCEKHHSCNLLITKHAIKL